MNERPPPIHSEPVDPKLLALEEAGRHAKKYYSARRVDSGGDGLVNTSSAGGAFWFGFFAALGALLLWLLIWLIFAVLGLTIFGIHSAVK